MLITIMQAIPHMAMKLCTTKKMKTSKEGVGTAHENRTANAAKNQNILMKFLMGKASNARKDEISPPHLWMK